MQKDVQTRRGFLDYVLNGGFAAAVLAAAYPVFRFLSPSKISQAEQSELVAAKVGELAPNSGKVFKFGSSPAILVNTPTGELRAFTAVCTHLGCTVQYRSDYQLIYCACHNGRYDLNGSNVAGPPPLPLEQYQVAIRGDDIVVMKKA